MVQAKLAQVGASLAEGQVLKADTSVATIDATVGTNSAVPTGIYSSVAAIGVVVRDLSADVRAQTASVYDHVDAILASDCQANLVTVPILSVDSAGFYAEPSKGLIKSLQSYLDTRKEKTQVVSVVSGTDALVRAVLKLRIGILPNFVQSVAEASTLSQVDALLKARQFDESLYVSNISDVIDLVPGVAFVDVNIEGHLESDGTINTTYLDVNGNLVIPPGRVVTKGSVELTSVILKKAPIL